MNYTIAVMELVEDVAQVEIGKNGNKYFVGVYNKDTKEYAHKDFDTINKAYEAYNILCELFIKHLGTFNDKVKVLKEK